MTESELRQDELYNCELSELHRRQPHLYTEHFSDGTSTHSICTSNHWNTNSCKLLLCSHSDKLHYGSYK